MKKVGVILLSILLILPLITAISMTSKAIDNMSDDLTSNTQKENSSDIEDEEDMNESIEDDSEELKNNETEIEDENETEDCEEWKCSQWSTCLNEKRIRACNQIKQCTDNQEEPTTVKRCKEKERLKPSTRATDCPNNCTCTGSVTKCILPDGTREMTITAGKSGNIIIQIKGINASTNITLYKSDDGKLYAINKNNETKRIRMLPDQVKEKLIEKTEKVLEKDDITLNEDGNYVYEGKKKSKLFLFMPIQIKVRAEIDAETGKIISASKPNWWEFLTKDETENIVGASCGTVTPGENNNCCISKGYNYWNSETNECEFSEEN